MVLWNVAGGDKKLSKTQTKGPKTLEYGLKWSQNDTLHDQWFLQTFFFKKCSVGVLSFLLSVKNAVPKCGG